MTELPANNIKQTERCVVFGSMHKYFILPGKLKKKKVMECLLYLLSYGNFQA